MNFLFVLAVGRVAGTISGIVGTGSSIMLMPVLVYQYGPKQAVPIMAVAAVMANLSRVLAWWREVDWRACAAYSVTGIPAAALGARTIADDNPLDPGPSEQAGNTNASNASATDNHTDLIDLLANDL